MSTTGRSDSARGRDDAETASVGDEALPDEALDDEALSWGQSSDRSYVEGPTAPRGDGSAGSSDDADDADEADEVDELPEGVLSSGMLVVHGVFAAVLLLYTIAWLRSIGSVAPSFDSSLAAFMWRAGTWLAVAAPAIWFLGTLWLVPTRRSRSRVISFVAAVALLIPWPFLIGQFS